MGENVGLDIALNITWNNKGIIYAEIELPVHFDPNFHRHTGPEQLLLIKKKMMKIACCWW